MPQLQNALRRLKWSAFRPSRLVHFEAFYFDLRWYTLSDRRHTKHRVSANQQIRRLQRGPPRVQVSDKTIAVLPFENLRAEKGDGFFADGIRDDVLTSQAKSKLHWVSQSVTPLVSRLELVSVTVEKSSHKLSIR
jgi:hypothetical protein